jgi:hypothetical protein
VASHATHNPPDSRYEKLSIFAVGSVALAVVVGTAFAAGWLIGRMLL